MTDNEETVAERIRAFIAAAQVKASSRGFPRQINVQMAPGAPKDSVLATYEECVSKLTIEQRTQLVILLEKMSEVFRDRSGAIP